MAFSLRQIKSMCSPSTKIGGDFPLVYRAFSSRSTTFLAGRMYPVIQECAKSSRNEDQWLWGWDPTPGIVSVWAGDDGRAIVWRRLETGVLAREEARFRPWVLLDRLDDLRHLGSRLGPEGLAGAVVTFRELQGPGTLRYLVRAAALQGASRRLGRRLGH
jgi:hypothetical protein